MRVHSFIPMLRAQLQNNDGNFTSRGKFTLTAAHEITSYKLKLENINVNGY